MNFKNIFFSFILLLLISCGGGGPIETYSSSDDNKEITINEPVQITVDSLTIEANSVNIVTDNQEHNIIQQDTTEESNTTAENVDTNSSETSSQAQEESVSPNKEENHIEPADDTQTESIFRSFNVGFGGSGSFSFLSNDNEAIWLNSTDLILDDNIESNAEYLEIKYFDTDKFDILQQRLKNSKFIVYWITKYWQESWHNLENIQNAMNQGYIPVFNYWYFADELGGGLPDDDGIEQYYEHNHKVADFLSQLDGTILLVIEPEFNKNVIIEDPKNQEKFIDIISKAIDNIKSNTKDIKFSLCMMDTGSRSVNNDSYEVAKCGYENCSLGDKYEWDKLDNIYGSLLSKLDFISFEQMIAQFNRKKIPYTNDDIGIDFLATRINNLSKYLKDKYNKPIFMPYIAIATASWNDDNGDSNVDDSELDLSGWEDEANHVYKELMQNKQQLLDNGLFGFAVMSLFDEPRHDINGYQYFMNNEYHLGVIKSSAVDEVDQYGFGDIVFKQDIVDIIFKDK
jgi:hypothetical protein